MKKKLVIFLLLLSLFIIPVKAEGTLAENSAAVAVTAPSAILVEASTGTIIYDKECNYGKINSFEIGLGMVN